MTTNEEESADKINMPELISKLKDSQPKESVTEADMIDRRRLDHLYTDSFKDGTGKYFTVISSDESGMPEVVDAEAPQMTKNKIKTRLTFIKSEDGGHIKSIELRRFKFYKNAGYVEQEECLSFSFPFFVGLIGFLQSFSSLNLNDITERRIPLHNGPSLDEETRRQFYTLVATDTGQELIKEVVKNGQLSGSDIVNIAYRKKQLEVFQELLENPDKILQYRADNGIKKLGNEAIWQHFFESNTWIFGYGLNFVFNQPLEGKKLEQAVKGSDVASAGKITDGLLKSTGIVSSICLVEIKKPETELLEEDTYRADCWQASRELSGAISQAQKTVQKTLENLGKEFRPNDKDGNPTGEVLFSYRPKSYLIVGSLSEFKSQHGVNPEKFGSFELMRRATLEPEIITFDELLERAKFIVLNSQ